MVLWSAVQYWRDKQTQEGASSEGKPHIITSNLEHDSVARCLERLEKEGQAGTSLSCLHLLPLTCYKAQLQCELIILFDHQK